MEFSVRNFMFFDLIYHAFSLLMMASFLLSYKHTVNQMKTLKVQKKVEPLVCAAVGAVSHWYRLEGCTMCNTAGNMLKNDKSCNEPVCTKLAGKNVSEVFL
jgi:hypothetical protein